MPRGRSATVSGALPPLQLDRSDRTPLYARVAHHIEVTVAAGLLKAGDRLDGEIGLAEQLGVSRQTMRRAIEELVNRGLLVRKHGVGTQVAPVQVGPASGVSSLYDVLVQAGKRPRTRVRVFKVRSAADEVAAALELMPGAEVLHLERLRSDDGMPLAIMRNWLPVDLVELEPSGLEKGGLYELLRAAGVDLRIAHQSIGAESATVETGALLAVPEGAALLSMNTVTFAGLGRPVELGRHTYRSDNFRFEITNVAR